MESVRRIRLERGWSQQDLADKSGVGQDTISAIETGRHEPRPSTLRKLAATLGVEVADFFREPVPLGEAPWEAGPPIVKHSAATARLKFGGEIRLPVADLVDILERMDSKELSKDEAIGEAVRRSA